MGALAATAAARWPLPRPRTCRRRSGGGRRRRPARRSWDRSSLVPLAHEVQRASQRHAARWRWVLTVPRCSRAAWRSPPPSGRSTGVQGHHVGLAFGGCAHQAPQLRAVPRQLDLVRGPAGPQPTQGQGLRGRRPAARRGPAGDDLVPTRSASSKPPRDPRPPTRPAPPAPASATGSEPVSDHPNATNGKPRWANAPNAAVVHRPAAGSALSSTPHTPTSPVGTIRLTRMPGRPDQSGEHDSERGIVVPLERSVSQVARRGGRQGLGHLEAERRRRDASSGAKTCSTSAQEGRPAHRPPISGERAMDAGHLPGMASWRAGGPLLDESGDPVIERSASMGPPERPCARRCSVTAMCSDGRSSKCWNTERTETPARWAIRGAVGRRSPSSTSAMHVPTMPRAQVALGRARPSAGTAGAAARDSPGRLPGRGRDG